MFSMIAGASPSEGSSITTRRGFVTQRAPDREHLLLATRELRAAVALALGEPREELVDALARPLAARLRAGRAPRGDPQVLVDGERREEATALRDVADAVPRDLVRLAADELLAARSGWSPRRAAA